MNDARHSNSALIVNLRRMLILVATISSFGATPLTEVHALDNWPAWRGPTGNSMSVEAGAPLVWSERRNVKFRTEIPGAGASSPIVWEDAIFVTSQDDEALLLMRINRADGAIVWKKEVGQARTPRDAPPGRQVFHELNNLASPTPATDGEVIIATFGNGLIAAYDFDGNELWKRNLQDDFGYFTFRDGYSSSPILFEDVVISACIQQDLTAASADAAPAYLVAHDRTNGHLKWRTLRPTAAKGVAAESYGTPALRHNSSGDVELVVMGANVIDGYNPTDGTRLWSYKQALGGRLVCSPTIVGGSLVGLRSTDSLFLLSMPQLTPVQEEEVTNKDVTWDGSTALPETCTPVAWGDMLFTVTDDGLVSCYEGASGRMRWRRRIPGKYRASPVAANGRIYFLNETGLCTIMGASASYDRLAENQLDVEQTFGSPAISNQQLFIRGKEALYCITRY